MNVRKHFRMSNATIDLIVADIVSNKIVSREICFNHCVLDRLDKLNNQYEQKLDKILTYIISHCSYANLPIDCLSKIIFSLSKVTNALVKGLVSVIGK